MRALTFAAFLVWALSPAAVSAQTPTPPGDWTVSLAGRVWGTSGWSNWNFKSAGVDPLADVRGRGVDAVVGEVAADVAWKRLVWMLSVGGTRLDDGLLIREDFARSDRQARFSLTRSPVDEGHLFYVNNDVGARVLRWREPLLGPPAASAAAGYLDAFVGYQFWREAYTAFGVQGSLFLAPTLTIDVTEPGSVKVLTHEYTRHSLRLGARTQIPLVGGLSLRALAAISPWTHTQHEATDFVRHDPGSPTVSRAHGGFGAQLEAGLAYAAWRGLSVEAGLRYWYFDSGSGEVTTTSVNGTRSRDPLIEAVTERYGPYVGLAWRF